MDRQLKRQLRGLVLEEMDLSKNLTDDEILELIDSTIIQKSRDHYIDLKEKSALRWEIFNSLRRLDVLQELVEDREITEIMINGAAHVFYEKNGRINRWEKGFESEERLFDVIQQIVSRANRIVNEASPIVDVCLEDGSRVNIVLPPIALDGAIVTIRKFPETPIDMNTLVQLHSLTQEVADFLRSLVEAKYNIFISGDNVIIGLSPSDFRKEGSHNGLVHFSLISQ